MDSIEKIMEELRNLTQQERQAFLTAYKKEFCRDCGANNPNCTCWMSE